MDSCWSQTISHSCQATEEQLKTTLDNFKRQTLLAKHHAIGAKAAKTRFAGILNVEEPPNRR